MSLARGVGLAVLLVAARAVADEGPSPEDVRTVAEDAALAAPHAAPPAPSVDAPTAAEPTRPTPSSVAPTGALRVGTYADADRTVVFRALAAAALTGRNWNVNAAFAADVVSSASVDVRSSPALSKVDVVTTASGTSTSGGKMFDRRLQGTLGGGWHRDDGRAFNLSLSYANERDYDSVNVGLNGSVDVNHRMTTLLGGVAFTHNWIGSTLDATFAETMYNVAWALGIAQVLGQRDALRIRYDGNLSSGYQASPYRSVRFGDWTATAASRQSLQYTFSNTIGAAAGLAEHVPDLRVRNALTLEWLHSISTHWSVFPQLRLGIDTWHLMSAAAALELRGAWTRWRLQLGYRFYAQSSADFYQAKYVNDPSTYTYYTSDKELSREYGHVVNLGITRVLRDPRFIGDPRVLLDINVVGQYYQYPDFVLLGSRWGGFFELGVSWE